MISPYQLPILMRNIFFYKPKETAERVNWKVGRNWIGNEKEACKNLTLEFYSRVLHCSQESTNKMTTNVTCELKNASVQQ